MLYPVCTKICFDDHKYHIPRPKLLKMSKVATVRKRQMEKMDPLVQKIAEEASMEPEYMELS